MKVVYYDGGILECSTIMVCEDYLIADDIYIIRYEEISYIMDNDKDKEVFDA